MENNVRKGPRKKGLEFFGLDSSGSGYEPVAGPCEHGFRTSGLIQGGEFLDKLSDY
jgi:hypothetical protein